MTDTKVKRYTINSAGIPTFIFKDGKGRRCTVYAGDVGTEMVLHSDHLAALAALERDNKHLRDALQACADRIAIAAARAELLVAAVNALADLSQSAGIQIADKEHKHE